jgi:hypothetical protein
MGPKTVKFSDGTGVLQILKIKTLLIRVTSAYSLKFENNFSATPEKLNTDAFNVYKILMSSDHSWFAVRN